MFELVLFAALSFMVIGALLSSMILYAKKKLISTDLCRIGINQNDDLSKRVEGGKTLLATLAENGIALPSPCGGKATCKQCKVQIIGGGGDILETDRASFSPKQLKEGWRLSCQLKVKNDLEIKVPESLLDLREFVGTVVSNENVATFIKELVVDIAESEALHYIPGDYLQVHVPVYLTNTEEWKKTMDEKYYLDWERFHLFGKDIHHKREGEIRAYSMASYPAEGNRLRFNVRIATPPIAKGETVKQIPWGVCSSYLFSLREGDQIKLSGPFGESHMIDDERGLIFLIGGAGSSFGRSHILDLFKTKQTKREGVLWYGARSLKENIYQEEYEALAKECQNFDYKLVLSQPTEEDLEQGWPKDDPIRTNYLFKAFEDGQLKKMEDPENYLYYVCGPPLHNSSVMKLLDDYGIQRENIVLDDFGS